METTAEKPAPKAVAVEDLKSAWERVNPRTPDGCEMTLYFEGHYGRHKLTTSGDDWEYVGAKWKASLRQDSTRQARETLYAMGDGDTPDAAMDAAISDLFSKRRRVEANDLAQFREWRAARDRREKFTPHTQAEWDEAVSAKVEDKDEDEDEE